MLDPLPTRISVDGFVSEHGQPMLLAAGTRIISSFHVLSAKSWHTKPEAPLPSRRVYFELAAAAGLLKGPRRERGYTSVAGVTDCVHLASHAQSRDTLEAYLAKVGFKGPYKKACKVTMESEYSRKTRSGVYTLRTPHGEQRVVASWPGPFRRKPVQLRIETVAQRPGSESYLRQVMTVSVEKAGFKSLSGIFDGHAKHAEGRYSGPIGGVVVSNQIDAEIVLPGPIRFDDSSRDLVYDPTLAMAKPPPPPVAAAASATRAT
jgi:hypothetical protein